MADSASEALGSIERRLAELLDAIEQRSPDPNAGENPDPVAQQLARAEVAAARVRRLAQAFERLNREGRWDTADALSARLLLEELKALVGSLRAAANGLAPTLEVVLNDTRQTEKTLTPEPDSAQDRT